MFTFIIPLIVFIVCLVIYIVSKYRDISEEEAIKEHERLKAQAAAKKQAEAEKAAAEKRAAAEQRRAEAHALKAARAEELAQLAERRLAAEKEAARLRAQAQRPQIISAPDSTPAMTLDQFTASVTPPQQPFAVDCMLAKKYAENAAMIAGKSFTITEKLDGVRCIARVDRGSVSLYTRSGKRLEGLTAIEKALSALDISAVLDGELLIAGRGSLPSKEEYKKTCSILRTCGQKTGIVYHVFDMLPLSTYQDRAASLPYAARRDALQRLQIISPVEIVPVLYSGSDPAQIENHLKAQREAHHEGIMINLNDAPYAYTRSACMLKYKVMNDCDLIITGVNAGSGKYQNTLGSLTVDYKGCPVRVGAGIPDALRFAVWQDPQAYIGRVASIQYFEETEDKSGKKSLRFPAFKALREIGKSVSYA